MFLMDDHLEMHGGMIWEIAWKDDYTITCRIIQRWPAWEVLWTDDQVMAWRDDRHWGMTERFPVLMIMFKWWPGQMLKIWPAGMIWEMAWKNDLEMIGRSIKLWVWRDDQEMEGWLRKGVKRWSREDISLDFLEMTWKHGRVTAWGDDFGGMT